MQSLKSPLSLFAVGCICPFFFTKFKHQPHRPLSPLHLQGMRGVGRVGFPSSPMSNSTPLNWLSSSYHHLKTMVNALSEGPDQNIAQRPAIGHPAREIPTAKPPVRTLPADPCGEPEERLSSDCVRASRGESQPIRQGDETPPTVPAPPPAFVFSAPQNDQDTEARRPDFGMVPKSGRQDARMPPQIPGPEMAHPSGFPSKAKKILRQAQFGACNTMVPCFA